MGKGSKNFTQHHGEANTATYEQQQQPSSSVMEGTSGHKAQYSWTEIKRHSTKNDRWLVIEKRVYDVTRWTKHPGGQVLLNHYAGQDATEAFRAFHRDTPFVKKYLKPFYIGDLIEDSPPDSDEDAAAITLDKNDEALKRDFELLRQKAIANKWFQSSRTFFIITCLHILALEIMAYFVIFRYGISWLPYVISLASYVAAEAQCGWVQHDFGHLSAFKKSGWNHLLQQIYVGFTKGASADWWNHMHYQHHAKPNVIDKDPDTRIEPLFLLGDKLPIRKAERDTKCGKTMPYDWQHIYFFIAAPLLFPVYFQIMTIRHAIVRRRWKDVSWLSLFYIKFFCLMSLKLGFFGAFKYHFMLRVFEGLWFVIVTQSNHVVMDVSHDDSTIAWARMQLKATCNISKSWFNDWFTGHLNFQIEHHLFPTMPRHNLYKVKADVMELCRKHKMNYIDKPMGRAFLDIFLSLEKSGRMWLETYEDLIKAASL